MININNSNKNKLSTNGEKHLTDISIVRVAAFSFAIVSWQATASGLSAYVFGSGWQSVFISFGIQSILFVLNLKLPFYFHCIGMNSPERTKKRYLFGKNKGKEKSAYKTTVFQRVIIIFYIVVLLSSSFFSFVYICNYVVYEHQSGYVDDNTILASTYREILNDTADYIEEDTKAMQILASKLLGELKNLYPVDVAAGNSVSLQELNERLAKAEDAFAVAEEDYNTAKSDAERLKNDMESYAQSRNSTIYHDRQDDWEGKYKEAKGNYDTAIKDRNSKQKTYNDARTNLTNAKNAVTNYKKPQDTVIAEFLVEMLKPSPSPEALEGYINELNAMLVDLDGNVAIIENYSKLVETTQTLTTVVKDYITLVHATENGSDNNIAYLMDHVMDDIVIPNPKSESFESDYNKWRKDWEIKLNTHLENTLIDIELLSNYKINDKMNIIDELRRNKISDINVIEKASSLLFGKYRFSAWCSLALALFFDLSSLLAGLIIYGIRKKSVSKTH